MRRRTSLSGLFASKNFRTASRSCSCSSENAKFKVSLPLGVGLPGLAREPEHPLADDVALDLAGAGVDRLRPAEHERALQLVDLVVLGRVALDDRGGRTEHVHRELPEIAVPRAPEQLADARLGPEHALAGQAG